MGRVPQTLLLAASLLGACAGPTGKPSPATIKPVASSETRTRAAGWGERSWLQQHQDGVRHIQSHQVDLLLLGDSITQSFGGEGRSTGQPGREELARALPGLAIANQGISGDRTQHVIWRLQDGALGGTCPPMVGLMIGTNNLPHDSAADIALGIEEIVARVGSACPHSTILLMALPPRGASADDSMREKVRAINARIRTLGQEENVDWVDPWATCLRADGSINPEVMAADAVHLNRGGYRLWAEALSDAVDSQP